MHHNCCNRILGYLLKKIIPREKEENGKGSYDWKETWLSIYDWIEISVPGRFADQIMCEKRNVFKRFWSQARKKWKFRFEFFFFPWRGKTIVLRNIKFFPRWMACKFKNPIFVRFLGSNLIRRFLSSNIFKRGHISMFVYYIWCRRQIVILF